MKTTRKGYIDGAVLILILAITAIIITPILVFGSIKKDPSVIVQMPKDAQPLATLESDIKVIGEDKAVLWWTVFKHMSDKGYSTTAIEAANDAVDKVYNSK